MRIITYTFLLVFMLLGSTSCGTINKITGNDNNRSSRITALSDKLKQRKSSSTRGKRNAPSAITTEPDANPNTDHRTFNRADSLRIMSNLAGQWYFSRVHDIDITGDEDRPTLTFDESTTRIYAYNGCNYFHGTYSLGGPTEMDIHDVLGTTALCDSHPWETAIQSIWTDACHFRLSTAGTDRILEFTDSRNRIIACLKRHATGVVNGMWGAVEINGRTIDSNNPMIVIDLIENRIHGNTGCNIFNGTIYQNPDAEMSLQFQDMSVTRSNRHGVETETAFLVALEQVENAIVIDNDNIVLADGTGRHLIKLTRNL